MQVSREFVGQSIWHWLSLGLGVGTVPWAAGTFATLVAWLFYYPLQIILFTPVAFGLFLSIGFALGIVACHITAQKLGEADPKAIVWDEMIAFWLTLFILAPLAWQWSFIAFVLFRIFDIVKPLGIAWFDENVHGGLGIMLDDLIAAFWTLFTIALLIRSQNYWNWLPKELT